MWFEQATARVVPGKEIFGLAADIKQKHTRSETSGLHLGRYQSGQMGQTVNLVAMPSGVRIPPFPQIKLIIMKTEAKVVAPNWFLINGKWHHCVVIENDALS